MAHGTAILSSHSGFACSCLHVLLTEMLLTRSRLWLSAIVPTPEERADVRLAAICGLSNSVRNVLELPFTTYHCNFSPNPPSQHHLAPTFLIFLLSTSHISPSDTSYFSLLLLSLPFPPSSPPSALLSPPSRTSCLPSPSHSPSCFPLLPEACLQGDYKVRENIDKNTLRDCTCKQQRKDVCYTICDIKCSNEN